MSELSAIASASILAKDCGAELHSRSDSDEPWLSLFELKHQLSKLSSELAPFAIESFMF